MVVPLPLVKLVPPCLYTEIGNVIYEDDISIRMTYERRRNACGIMIFTTSYPMYELSNFNMVVPMVFIFMALYITHDNSVGKPNEKAPMKIL